MSTYNFTVDQQFLISGTDASGTFSNESYPTISGSLGDVFSFTFLQSEDYAFSIEDTDFENKYDTSAGLTGTTENFTPSTTGTFLYTNPVDFETYGNIIVGTTATTTTTTSQPTTTVPPNPWTQLGEDIDSENNNDESGYSVSLSSDGSIVAIGSLYKSDDSRGRVRVYQWSGSSWTQLGQDIVGESEGDQSGYSVSLSSDGSRVAIGAPYNDGVISIDGVQTTLGEQGQVRVYQLSGSSWTRIGQDIQGESRGDYSGWSVSLSSDGSRVAIGAPYNDGSIPDGRTLNSGHVRVYQLSSSSGWQQLGEDIDSEYRGGFSGHSVSLSSDGNRVAIGEPYSGGNEIHLYRSGRVRVYQWSGSSWTQIGQDILGESISDQSGWSVSLSSDGSILAIGTRFAERDIQGNPAGHVRVYKLSSSSGWQQLGEDIVGETGSDLSGSSVSLSSDGSRVAIGSPNTDGVISIDGVQIERNLQGQVRVYQLSGSSWTQLGEDIDGEDEGDQSGYSVSLSSDGSRVAIGAPYNDGGDGFFNGHVRVYQLGTITDGTSSTTTIPPVGTDTCNCGSINFPASGNLIINNTEYPLLHSYTAYVGQEQTFSTVIDRISTPSTYPNSIKLDLSAYPTYVNHSIRLVIKTSEHELIASKYVGVNDTLLKIETPIQFNNINTGIDLYNKVIILNVESICNYEGSASSCCDSMPSSLNIEDGVNEVELLYKPPATTTTTTTPTASPPLPPTDPSRIVAPNTQYIAHPLNPDVDFYESGANDFVYNPRLFFIEDYWNLLWDRLVSAGVGGIVYPPHRYVHIINTRPLEPDPITRNYFDAWEKKEVGSSIFELQLLDRSVGDYVSVINNNYVFKNRITYDRFLYDTNRVQTSEDFGFEGTHYHINKFDAPTFNALNADTGLFRYYNTVSRLNYGVYTLRRTAHKKDKENNGQIFSIMHFANVHNIEFRSRVIVNGTASEWAVKQTTVKVYGYELLWTT